MKPQLSEKKEIHRQQELFKIDPMTAQWFVDLSKSGDTPESELIEWIDEFIKVNQ